MDRYDYSAALDTRTGVLGVGANIFSSWHTPQPTTQATDQADADLSRHGWQRTSEWGNMPSQPHVLECTVSYTRS